MKQRTIAIFLSVCCALLPACEANTRPHDASAPSKTQILNEISQHQALLLDVRTAEEYAAGHAPNAVLVPYDRIAQQINSLAPDKNQKIYLYCRSGRRSGIAFETLKGLGYTQLTDLGGLGQLGQYGLSVP